MVHRNYPFASRGSANSTIEEQDAAAEGSQGVSR